MVQDFRRIHESTAERDRIFLFLNPVRIEQRAGYRFRNVVPPVLAYYLDRPFDVQTDFAKVSAGRRTHSIFVISKKDAVRHGEALHVLRRRFREIPLTFEVVFDLRGEFREK